MPLTAELVTENCVKLGSGGDILCITLPGGVEICIAADPSKFDPADQVKKLFEQLNTALAPLNPIFTVLDAIIAIKDCITALLDALGPPPTPKPIIDCIEKLLVVVEKILKMLPQLSIPLMVLQFLDALIDFANSFKNQVERLINKTIRLAESSLRAAELGNLALQASIDCTTENVTLELKNIGKSAEPINRLVGVINAFLDIIGLPCIPSLEAPDDLNAEKPLEPLCLLIKILEALRDAIPALPSSDGGFSKPCE